MSELTEKEFLKEAKIRNVNNMSDLKDQDIKEGKCKLR